MVRISVELTGGAARFRVAVQAESVRRALEIVERRNPGCNARVVFPIDPEAFFVGDPAARSGLIEREPVAA